MLFDPYAFPVRLFTHKMVGVLERLRGRDGRGPNAPPTFRNWIEPMAAPRLTTRQAPQSQPASAQQSNAFNRFQKISGTCRRESTTRCGSAEKRENRRHENLICADEKSNDPNHERARIEARFARRNHSSSNAAKLERAAAGCAMTTIKIPLRNSC